MLQGCQFRLEIDFLFNQGIFQFLEFPQFKAALDEGRIETVEFGLERHQLRLEAPQLLLLAFASMAFPSFDFGEKFFLPLIWQDNRFDIPFHFLGKFLLPDETAVFAPVELVFVRAPVVEEAKAALLDVPLGRNAVATRAAGGKITEKKPFFILALAWFADHDQRLLDVVKSLLRNHGDVCALVHLALPDEHAVIEGIAKEIANGGERHRLHTACADQPHVGHFPLNGSQGIFTSGEQFQNLLNL